MTWSYNSGDLLTSEVDQIRLEVADTDAQYPLLQNEEIQHAIDAEQNYWAAAARCAEYIARIFLRKADVKLGRAMTVAYTKAAEQYFQMAVSLRRKALGTQVPYFGGTSVTTKVGIAMNTDLVNPAFTRQMLINPWTGGYTPDTLPPFGGSSSSAIFGGEFGEFG